MKFDDRKTATILGALRYFQRHQVRALECGVGSNPIPEDDIITNGGTFTPLTPTEIDLLCEEINIVEPTTRAAHVLTKAFGAAFEIIVPNEAWQKTGQVDGDPATAESDDTPESRLLCSSVVINGLSMHLEAYEVKQLPVEHNGMEYEEQVAANSAFEDEVGSHQAMQDTTFQTTEIMGRTYILVATPHGD